jgi:RimJ/RimL family protein N-acetyltransferase
VTAAYSDIRPIEPGDKPLVRAFYHELSDRSKRLRFLVPTNEISDEDLIYLTDVDHRRHEAMVALDGERLVGVARYVRAPRDREAAEVAVAVADDRQNEGIGTALLDSLTERARENGIVRYTALVSPDNDIVLGALDRAGATRTGTSPDGEIELAVDLPAEGLGERLHAALRGVAVGLWRLRP